MVILPATEADLQAVIELVAQGRAALARQGVDQWQDGYPSPETIRRDLLCGDGRIVRIDGAAAAYAAFVFDGEPAYDRIEEGSWAAEGPYVAVHRLVVGERFVRRGVAAALLREAAREALVRGIRSFRIDTHPDNGPMRALLVREGSPVGARCATKPCGWLTRSRSSADPLRYVTASGDGCRNIRADDLNQGGYIPFCTAASPKRALSEALPGRGRSANAALPRMLRQSVVCSGSENRRGAELYTAA